MPRSEGFGGSGVLCIGLAPVSTAVAGGSGSYGCCLQCCEKVADGRE